MEVSTHLHLMLRSRKSGFMPLLPITPCAIMVWTGTALLPPGMSCSVHNGMVEIHTWHKGKQTTGIFHPCQACDSNFQSAQPDCSSCAALASLRDLGSRLDLTVGGQLENVPSHALEKIFFTIYKNTEEH